MRPTTRRTRTRAGLSLGAALTVLALGLAPRAASAGASAQDDGQTLDQAADDLQQQLLDAEAELGALRTRIQEETLPLSRRLAELKAEREAAQSEYQQAARMLEGRKLDLSNLRTDIKTRRDEIEYLQGLLSDYVRKFDSRLHVSELARYADVLDAALLAPENENLGDREVFAAQAALVASAIERLGDGLAGDRFEGSAVDPNGLVRTGEFVVVGPVAVFRSEDGGIVGTVERRADSSEPTLVPFNDPADAEAAAAVVRSSAGSLPVDVTLGNAAKLEATQESFVEHVQKGGPVMVPIFAMAAAALLVALYKWIYLTTQRSPSRKAVDALLSDVAEHDLAGAREKAAAMRGPVGEMLRVGVEHVEEPRELIEEAMYETVLKRRLKLNALLPFVAICAASAPLLGLLGTVTGIINTFKLITVFGSGDVKSLSGGISEALITTKFGLVVAIPSLLLHAFLSRKARGIVGQMETTAVSFANQVSRTPFARTRGDNLALTPVHVRAAERTAVKGQVKEVLSDILGRLDGDEEREDALASTGRP